MVFTLLVLNSPWQGQATQSAYRFANAALASGHQLRQVFFYGDGAAVLQGGGGAFAESVAGRAWEQLAVDHGVPLIACTSAAARRGIDRAGGAVAAPGSAGGARPGLTEGTLGQLMIALPESERLLTFAD
jgi:tRNA 2-thiouridine synthesizing protein D